MATKSYNVTLAGGSMVTIDDVETVEKDGSGLRLYDADGNIIASWVDGESRSCYPASATVTPPAETATGASS